MLKWIFAAMAACAASAAPAETGVDPLAPIDWRPMHAAARSSSPISPDVFGTVALNAGITDYGARWRRVSAADLADPRLAGLAAAASALDPLARLAVVQSEVRRRIAWREERDGYWAQAGETLTRGTGDSDDIAILKMQALKAMGFAARDIYLSIGRDSQRGADTRLLVRAGGRFYVLDDRAERPLAAEHYAGFVPVITLGKNSAWLHGRRIGSREQGAARAPVMRQALAR